MSKLICPNCGEKFLGIAEAAKYLGKTLKWKDPRSSLKYHIYAGNIKPQLLGHSLVFTKQQLDEFLAAKRPRLASTKA